jgi:hypothetical protein
MSQEARIYNPDEMTIVVGPVLINSGFAEDDFMSVEGESDTVADVSGADGEVAISRSNDHRATVTITLLQTALANQGLSVLSNLTRTSPNMVGAVVPFLARDQNGTSLYTAKDSWVMKPPDAAFGRTAKERAWPIRCANLLRNDGSNNLIAGA